MKVRRDKKRNITTLYFRPVEVKAQKLCDRLYKYAQRRIREIEVYYKDDPDLKCRLSYYNGFKDGVCVYMANASKWRFPRK